MHIKAAIEKLQQGRVAYRNNDIDLAFRYFQDAHILGQSSTLLHARSHWWMLKTAWQSRRWPELIGQASRLLASLAFSWLWVPAGNSGRASVSAFRPMPIPDHLKVYFNEQNYR